MINLIVLPILIPLLTAVLLIFFASKVKTQRWISAISALLNIGVAFSVVRKVFVDGIQILNVGSWVAPFGITLVSDMLSALLVLTTTIIGFAVILYSFSSIGKEREKYYYYALVQFLLVGVIGAFTTGDIFNLFVFFEVMLMASYVLLVIGGTKIQLRESLKYLTVNVISSALFVISVAYLYSVVGTLNMAQISERIGSLEEMPGILTVIAVLFLIVFGMKGAIFPLYFWLPGSYFAPPIPVMALFGALLTKVGVYSIIRTFTLFFFQDKDYTYELLMILAIITVVVGVIGSIAYWNIKKIIIYNIITAIGVILYGVSVATTTSFTGSILYLIHDMLIKAALFLLIGVMIKITGTSNLRQFSGLIKHYPGLAWTFFIAAISLAGIPPFSGFVGKLLVIQGGFTAEEYIGATIILLSSLLVLYSVMKIFIHGFWGVPKEYAKKESISYRALLFPIVLIITISVLYGIGSDYVYSYVSQAVQTLVNPELYIEAVLKE
ncbi:Na+/H+ antiporter subunit D [Caldibacillus lycopersici]|uniref:Na+/H+ antiporter subunit D n=1 Tax=Perspicuibacillus lycopersici TaxID=1325689 RepID=A0AAE3LMB7_9BACI|nr:Na+/H+ antiporter subunit D [Perspicuibacillus lycopersici]MCU9612776.1 Na+/H+ antiporter subunit D [Perspicuibacillus lycopersici]